MRKWNIWNKLHRIASAVLVLTGLSLTACDDSEGYSLGDMAIDWATVRMEGPHACEFQADTWGRLWPAATDVYLDKLTNGQRVILTFNPLYDNYPNGYDCSMKVLGLRKILTKGIEELTEENDTVFGHDPLILPDNGMWVSGNCLNVVFAQRLPVVKKHRISLVRRSDAALDKDGYLLLELRCNTYGDTTDRLLEAAVSFHLTGLEFTPEVKGIKVKVHAAGDGKQEWVFNRRTDEATPALQWETSPAKQARLTGDYTGIWLE